MERKESRRRSAKLIPQHSHSLQTMMTSTDFHGVVMEPISVAHPRTPVLVRVK